MNNFIDEMRLKKDAQEKILSSLFENGVIFLSTDGIIIESTVKIGKGTLIYPNVILKGETIIGENCTITSGTTIENCVIGNNTIINASQCYSSEIGNEVKIGPFSHIRPNSKISDHVKIGDFVEIKNSFLDVGVSVSHLTYVGDSDIGKNVNFGCGCVTVNYDGVNKARCTVKDNAFIGCNTNLIAPVTVGTNTFIAAGSTITDDLPDDGFAIARSRQTNKENLGKEKLKNRKLKY